MRAVFLILLGMCGAIALQAQPSDTLVVQRSLPLSARRATTDQLGNLYLVTTGNALEKYTPEGLFLTRFTNNRLGAIQSVDVSNPLKVLVWYADFRTVVFLDRSLTPSTASRTFAQAKIWLSCAWRAALDSPSDTPSARTLRHRAASMAAPPAAGALTCVRAPPTRAANATKHLSLPRASCVARCSG